MLAKPINLVDARLHMMPGPFSEPTYGRILLTHGPSPTAGELIACVYGGAHESEERRHWEQLFCAAPLMYAALRDIIASARKAGIELIDLSRGAQALAEVEK